MNRKSFSLLFALLLSALACQTLFPDATQEPIAFDPATQESQIEQAPMPDIEGLPTTNFSDLPALPNDSGIAGVQTYPDKSQYHNHIDFVKEPAGGIPPAFGPHLGAWLNCGIYDQPVEVGNALHSLEHGAVWLTYSPSLSEGDVEYLRSLVRGNGYVLMSPYPKQIKPVVLGAWTVQLIIDSLSDERIAQFIAYYVNGPQNPEPGAPCSGAIGTPIE